MDPQKLVDYALLYVALLLALCVHEVAHAVGARVLGDSTAEEQGRITLNPLVHIDPVGTLMLPIIGLVAGGWIFGWARPTPVNPSNFRRGWYARGRILVAALGPVSNLVQAVAWVGVWALLTRLPVASEAAAAMLDVAVAFVRWSVLINLILMAFNLLPIPPLDGSHVVSWALPRELAERYDRFVGSYGLLLFIALLLPIFGGRSGIGVLLDPVLSAGSAALELAAG